MCVAGLRKLHISFDVEDMWGWDDCDDDLEDRFYFISKVTRLVAFDRMSKLKVNLPSFMEAPESMEEDDDEEDEESVEEDDDEEEYSTGPDEEAENSNRNDNGVQGSQV